MQYKDIETLFDSNKDIYQLALITGKSIKEVGKFANKYKNEAELWNHSHTELRQIIDVKRIDNEFGYQLVITTEEPETKYERKTKDTRSIFFSDNGEVYTKWKSFIGKKAIIYVSYNKNTKDGSVYRVAIDIDLKDN